VQRLVDEYETHDEEPEPEPIFPTAAVGKMAVHFSSDTPEHYTPKEIVEAVIECFGTIDLDPCSNSKETPNVPATTHYTIDDDGLAQHWHGKVYMNPPYGREIGQWVQKFLESYLYGDVTEAIALVPARPDTQWWKQLNEAYPLLCFVEGRLRFVNNDDPAPFPSAVIYLGHRGGDFWGVFQPLGETYQRLHPFMIGT
jgi:hypothetical protein